MRVVPVPQLRVGDRLGRDVFATLDGLPLLRAGIRVSESYQQSLLRAGIASVWIDDGLSHGIEPLEVLEETTRQQAAVAIRDAFEDAQLSLTQGTTLPATAAHEMRGVAELIVSDISRNVHSALALNDLANADGYTLKHSLAVTTLGLSLGIRVLRKYGWVDAQNHQRFDGITDRLAALGVGLLLHDIGKLAVPAEILQKPERLTDEEWQTMREHPTLGVQILKKADGISPLARAVVRSHHERWNGTGYPDGQARDTIHQFARIAAVADVFDALTSERHYRRPMPMREAYDYIIGRAGRDFDPHVVEIFKSCVSPYPPGSRVVLSDGSCGLVKDVKQGAVTTPIVRIIMDASHKRVEPHEIDLSRAPNLTVVGTEFDVTEEATVPVLG
jgi:HD-GYP domain-containing protein (c-di-GMP phosphodiesterase class II)